ncbi:MAG: hypothetical protein SRB2_00695 [Desulfobacteraceae bacterium Eth-SRB2]|nr:MAG: hypothetical protein SRB2_00695 [Desulfobacteraceae bacterium Eth-SRB2]
MRFDLEDTVAGKNGFNISEKDIVLPPGVPVKKIEPSTIDFILDMPGEKSLPVQVDWAGTLSKSILIQEVRVVPDRIVIKGAQMIIDTIDTIYTQAVSVDNIVRSGEISVPLALSPYAVKLADNQPDKIRVYFTVVPRQ